MSLGDWAVGQYIAAADLNTLLAMIPQGVVYDESSTANTFASSTTYVSAVGVAGSFTVSSPRTLQAIVQAPIQADVAGQVIGLRALINGVPSVLTDLPMLASGGPGRQNAELCRACNSGRGRDHQRRPADPQDAERHAGATRARRTPADQGYRAGSVMIPDWLDLN